MKEVKLSDWVKDIEESNIDDALPITKRLIKDINEQTIKLVQDRGYAYDMMGIYKIIKDD